MTGASRPRGSPRLQLACTYLGNASDHAAAQRLEHGLARQAQWPRPRPGAHTADPLFLPDLCHHCDAAVGEILLLAAGQHVYHHADYGQVHCHAAAAQALCLADC